jgi:hypothetical protein
LRAGGFGGVGPAGLRPLDSRLESAREYGVGLRPAAMRQLYMSTVASKLDYAAPIWFQSEKQGSRSNQAFEAIQKIGSRAIVRAYKTAAGQILEAEAGLLPTTLCLERRMLQYVINLHTLPKEHP